MIWTEEEDQLRQIDNLLDAKGKSCKGCNWSGYEEGNEFITCGHHLQNFTPGSFCAYWTDPNNPKLKAYWEKRKKELRAKLKAIPISKSLERLDQID